MAGQENVSCYSCEGTLLIPTVHGRVGGWRERLVSGNRLTIILRVVGERWSNDARFLLWGENYRQEKVFEVNLRYVREYFVRTRTWHEITASDRRRFALSFQDSNLFARFHEELEDTLSFLKKLVRTSTDKPDGAGSIAVLRVEKIAPLKPPRALNPGALTPPPDEHPTPDCVRQPQYPEISSRIAGMDGSPKTRESVNDVTSDEEQTTKWYVNIYDDVPTTPPDSKFDDISGIYDTIADLESSPPSPVENNTHEYIEIYDNFRDVSDCSSCATKPNKVNAYSNLMYDKKTTFFQTSHPTSQKPIETRLYDDSGSYDNITTDVRKSEPIAAKSKPRLPPPCKEPIKNRPMPGVTKTSDNTNQSRNIMMGIAAAAAAAAAAKPVPLPRTKKPNEDKSLEWNWACDQCTLINLSTANRCIACDSQHHESRVQTVTGSGNKTSDAVHRLPSSYLVSSACFLTLTANEDWTCSLCSARNQRESDACHSCLAWICSHCTLHNHQELWVCSVCSRSRLHS